MDTYTIVAATIGAMAVIALVYFQAYDLGFANALKRERALADRRVQGILDEINAKPAGRKVAKIRAKRRASK